MARRYYSSTAMRTTLSAGLTNTGTTMAVTSISGFPASFPYTLILDADTVNEEVVEVTGGASTTLTVVRGVDGTTGVSHLSGASVRHGFSARDLDEPNAHIQGTTSVHGIADTSTLLTASSTNTLTNKSISGSTNTLSNIAQSSVTSLTTDLAAKTPIISGLHTGPVETAVTSATAATGTINFDAITQAILYYTTSASGNWTLNVRGSATTSLNTLLATGQSVTVTFLVTNGGTAYYQSAFQVDGSAVTPKWQGGAAPTSGNVSSVDAYTVTVVKTGSAAFTAFAAVTRFA
jgi:hypothetical protein